jgi:CHAT domain-containing protein
MHLVPFDALPLDEESLVGDRWEVETRTTLTELLGGSEPSPHPSGLVAFGDVDYGAAAEPAPRADADAGILRGSAFEQGFSALPGTGVEVRGIADTFRRQFGSEAPLELVEDAAATRERLLSLAPGARFVHVATHGWFAPESIRSWSDPEPIDVQSGLGARLTGEEQVRGMSPMLLCGLALAGASRPESATGRLPGLVTAEELSALDLSSCDLVVLSACDTNVGVRRAGQGVASLQKALQMAGARSVITSLWKVPDEATRDLMLDFYRRLWVEKKSQGRALWEAKKGLREAQDERGRPIYSTRDWAAWVLTGEPE